MTVGSLFAGIGGMELGLERAGMTTKWQVELDPYARKVLAKHWPDVRRHDDITTFPPKDWTEDELRCDLICGGFPCQDISYAGKGAGLAGERSGLFYEAIRVVREVGPRYVLLENVAALLTRGLDAVLGTLASLGFDAEWHCIPAAAVGAPHIRDRVFVLAYAQCERVRVQGCGADAGTQARVQKEARERQRVRPNTGAICCDVADTQVRGRDVSPIAEAQGDPSIPGQVRPQTTISTGRSCRDVADADRQQAFGPAKPRAERHSWLTEPDVGRVAHGVPKRVDRLRCLGNAVVPQVAEWIGRRIMASERKEA